MGVLTGLGWLAVLALLTGLFYVLLGDEVGMIRERVGIDRREGWIAYVGWAGGSAVPFFLGARVEEGIGYPLSMTVFTVGVFGLAVAAANRAEYAAVRSADDRPVDALGRDDEGPVTVAGRVTDAATTSFGAWDAADEERSVPVTPFAGVEAVAVDWVYQAYGRVGVRRTWKNEAWGSLATPFLLETGSGSVVVDPADARVVGEQSVTRFDADDPLPDRTAAFLASRDDLPAPRERTRRTRIQEEYLPPDGEVTVVGHPSSGTGSGDAVDPTFAAGSVVLDDGGGSTLLLVAGDFAETVTKLRRRVLWAGVGGIFALVLGQGMALVLTRATLATP